MVSGAERGIRGNGPQGPGCWAPLNPCTLPQGCLEIELEFQQVFEIHLSNVVDNVLVIQQAGVIDTRWDPCSQWNLYTIQGDAGRRVRGGFSQTFDTVLALG